MHSHNPFYDFKYTTYNDLTLNYIINNKSKNNNLDKCLRSNSLSFIQQQTATKTIKSHVDLALRPQ